MGDTLVYQPWLPVNTVTGSFFRVCTVLPTRIYISILWYFFWLVKENQILAMSPARLFSGFSVHVLVHLNSSI